MHGKVGIHLNWFEIAKSAWGSRLFFDIYTCEKLWHGRRFIFFGKFYHQSTQNCAGRRGEHECVLHIIWVVARKIISTYLEIRRGKNPSSEIPKISRPKYARTLEKNWFSYAISRVDHVRTAHPWVETWKFSKFPWVHLKSPYGSHSGRVFSHNLSRKSDVIFSVDHCTQSVRAMCRCKIDSHTKIHSCA
jgi:hypothetical protein